ncbi:hypothetical protein C8235_03645 [Paracidovorax avenae]|nr:hypothetical protein C8235_03645 [Paracidovorax avenae]
MIYGRRIPVAMDRQATRHLKSAICFLLAAMIVAGLWQGTRPHLFHTSVSPYKTYRIEYYEVRPEQLASR